MDNPFHLPTGDWTPPFLLETEALELDQIPLHVCLLTLEIAEHRMRLAAMEQLISQMESNMASLILSSVKRRE